MKPGIGSVACLDRPSVSSRSRFWFSPHRGIGPKAEFDDCSSDPCIPSPREQSMAEQPVAPPRLAVAVTLVTVLACALCLVLLPVRAASNVSDIAQGIAA